MKGHIFRLAALVSLSTIASATVNIEPEKSFIATVYGVSGIIFSIGLSLIITFNLSGIKNKKYIESIRENLNNVRNNFIIYFAIATICYMLMSNNIDKFNFIIFRHQIHFSFSIFTFIAIIMSIVYFIVNFITVQKLKDDLFDRILEENSKK